MLLLSSFGVLSVYINMSIMDWIVSLSWEREGGFFWGGGLWKDFKRVERMWRYSEVQGKSSSSSELLLVCINEFINYYLWKC